MSFFNREVKSSNKKRKTTTTTNGSDSGSDMLGVLSTYTKNNNNNNATTSVQDPKDALQNRIKRIEAQTSTTTATTSTKGGGKGRKRQQQDIISKTAEIYAQQQRMQYSQRRPTYPISQEPLANPTTTTTGKDVYKVNNFDELTFDDDREALFAERLKKMNTTAQQQQQEDAGGEAANIWVNIPDNTKIFGYVKERTNRPLGDSIYRYAIKNNLELPKLPILSKADIRSHLRMANHGNGERDCVHGDLCVSYEMGRDLGITTPFSCRELCLNATGGNSLDIQMCVLCNLKIVTDLYYSAAYGLTDENDVHIIHNFQVIVNVEGEYPLEQTLFGDERYMGVIAPILKFSKDNYALEKPGYWAERSELLDFHERVVHH